MKRKFTFSYEIVNDDDETIKITLSRMTKSN